MPRFDVRCLENQGMTVTYLGIEADSLAEAIQQVLDENTAVEMRTEHIERISPFDLDVMRVDRDGKRLNLADNILNPLLPIEKPLLTP